NKQSAIHSRLIATPMLLDSIPLNCTVNGVLASSNLTLLRTPAQPVAPVAAIDLSRSPFCTTSIQPSDDNVILYVPLCAGADTSINPAKVSLDFGARSGVIGSFTSPNGSSVTVVANGRGH